MAVTQQGINNGQREVWLRRSASSARGTTGSWHSLWVSDIGNAAARETLVTATSQFAAIWTDLFEEMITADAEFRWRKDGPGIGRDARIAYSSLLGRYFARAYLQINENVRALVPLDTAKRQLIGTRYRIEKFPPGRGLEADWIGLDQSGLVIAEAKGSFNDGVGTWRGPYSVPQVLRTAIAQAERTAVFNTKSGSRLPAKRWAVASRWGTEHNGREPTLLAWDPEEEKLREDDYRALAKILHGADLSGVMTGLGHGGVFQMLRTVGPSQRLEGDAWLRIGGRTIEPGFAAMVWPAGVQTLRSKEDVDHMRRIRDVDVNIAIASLSSHYVSNIMNDPLWLDEGEGTDIDSKQPAGGGRFATRAGLSVVWPEGSEEIVMLED